MKNKKLFVFMVLVIIIFISARQYYNHKVILHPFKAASGNVNVYVENGESLYGVIEKMAKSSQINSSFLMKFYIRNKKVNTGIKIGKYVFPSGIKLDDLINCLNKGIYDNDTVRVTIPEGFDIKHIAKTLDEKGIIKENEFIASCKEYTLPSYIKNDPKRKYELEGYLFPDTYELKKNMKGKEIIDIFLNRFEYVINDIEKSNNITIEHDKVDSIIIMASIVEKEIKTEDERGKAASVFYNRLKKGMKLQSCATVLYALGYHKDKLSNNDLKVKSPFNTYIVKALPEGPICCPGKSSIIAAIKPDNTNFLYFVSNNDGTHTFTSNYNEFLNVKKKTQGIN